MPNAFPSVRSSKMCSKNVVTSKTPERQLWTQCRYRELATIYKKQHWFNYINYKRKQDKSRPLETDWYNGCISAIDLEKAGRDKQTPKFNPNYGFV